MGSAGGSGWLRSGDHLQWTGEEDEVPFNGSAHNVSQIIFTLDDPAPSYNISVGALSNGTVTAAAKSQAGKSVALHVTPNSGYELSDIHVKESSSGNTVALSGEWFDYTFTMPACAVTVTATFNAATVQSTYVDENGVDQPFPATYTNITSGSTSLSAGWYVVSSNVTIDSRITCTGDVHLILRNGTTFTPTDGITVEAPNSLTIYQQSAGIGAKIVIELQIPESVGARSFRIPHIHNETDMEYVEYLRKGDKVYVTVDRLSAFAFVVKDMSATNVRTYDPMRVLMFWALLVACIFFVIVIVCVIVNKIPEKKPW